MNRRLAAGTASLAGIALSFPLMVVTAGGAAAETSTKGGCVQEGLGTLRTLGGVQAFANGYDYSGLADPDNGPIYTTLTPGTELKLGKVVKLHTASPATFAWCR